MEPRITTTTIFLTDEEALSFVKFQKHRALIGVLEGIGAFDMKNGSITIHFNNLGEIKTVNKNEFFSL